MAYPYETMTDDSAALLEKVIKAHPKDTKACTKLHKEAVTSTKAVQENVADAAKTFTKSLDAGTRILQEALGVATDEAKLFDRAIVRHLKQAIDRSKKIPKPKGWTDAYDKAVKCVDEWRPTDENVDALEDAIKHLKSGKKKIQDDWAFYIKEYRECNALVQKAMEDLKETNDAHLKELVKPYFDRYRELFEYSE